MSDERIMLDSPEHCRIELERVSNAMATLTGEYQTKRGRLGDLEAKLSLVSSRTLIGTEGANKEEREAKVQVEIADDEETGPLLEEYKELQVEVEMLKTRIKTLESRGTHAANANNSLSAEAKFQGKANL